MCRNLLIPSLFLLLIITGNFIAQIPAPIKEWNFNELSADKSDPFRIIDSDLKNQHHGNFYIIEGVEGSALLFDCYTTWLSNDSSYSPKLKGSFSIEAWIALGAYPWNWAPIIAQENTESMNSNLDEYCWPDDIKQTSPKDGFYFGVGPKGELGLFLGVNYEFKLCKTEQQIPLYKWTHVAAVYDHENGVSLYIDGKLSTKMDRL